MVLEFENSGTFIHYHGGEIDTDFMKRSLVIFIKITDAQQCLMQQSLLKFLLNT